ncbi:MAG: hypothetical protein HY909_10010 [Deltaproteobacteria bacterium]|nr:hypothetical protein [Deltaproteobacteria bacterium]
MDRARCNTPRHDPGSPKGHYESWFQRANHPSRPLAFWIRYTIFHPKGGSPVGELWAIWFDGEREEVTAVKETFPWDRCAFGEEKRVGGAVLRDGALRGSAQQGATVIAWDLTWDGGGLPLLLLPEGLYTAGFPKAKALVGTPGASYRGGITVGGVAHEIDGWLGSQNHNWGERHTDRYAWGQVSGFDGAPDAFLECATARLKVGPVWTPWLTTAVLRLGGEELALNSLARAPLASATLEGLAWWFRTSARGVTLEARFEAPASRFVGLRYGNPPGGAKVCLNSKLARCELTVTWPGRPSRRLVTAHRAALELLSDEGHPSVPVVA